MYVRHGTLSALTITTLSRTPTVFCRYDVRQGPRQNRSVMMPQLFQKTERQIKSISVECLTKVNVKMLPGKKKKKKKGTRRDIEQAGMIRNAKNNNNSNNNLDISLAPCLCRKALTTIVGYIIPCSTDQTLKTKLTHPWKQSTCQK